MKSPMSTALALIVVASCAHGASPGTTQTGSRAEAQTSSLFGDDEVETQEGRACTEATTELAPSDGRIGYSVAGGSGNSQAQIVTYPVGSQAAPTVSLRDGAMHMSANTPIGPKAQYIGAALTFPKCTDASAFTGVRFSIRGTYSGCSLEYSTNDVIHQDRNTSASYALGKRGSYPPQTRLNRSEVTEVAQVLNVPFDRHTITGNPPFPLDKTKLTALVWQLTVPLADNVDDGAAACVASLDIENVTFYR